MAKEKIQSFAEEDFAEQISLLDELALEVESIRSELEELDRKESALAEGLVKAKEKGLLEQAERCRTLLQRVVVEKKLKQDELNEAEARKLSAKLTEMTDEIAMDLAITEPVEEEVLTEELAYFAKAKRMQLVSKMIGFIGVFGCLLGSMIYLLLAQPEVLNLAFEWIYLAITGAAAVVFIVVAMLIGSSASKYREVAEQIVEEKALIEAEKELEAREAAMTAAELNAVAEVYAIEANAKKAMEEAQKPKKKLLPQVKNVNVPQTVKDNVHKIVPVAAVACTTAVAVAALASSKKKLKAAKHSAAIRQEFFKWLG